MHYKINNITIKSENSAKPTSTPSKYFIELLNQYITHKDSVLDYGCGKLRYTIPLSKMAKSVYGVDSKEQIYRSIKIKGKETTVSALAKNFKNIILYTTDNSEWRKKKYDRILLSHVLSAVPHENDRINIINQLYKVMHDNSILIACTQHRMSYFKKWDKSSNVVKYNDGYFVTSPTTSYFGVINKFKLSNYFKKNIFIILKLFIVEDNTYCICKKK